MSATCYANNGSEYVNTLATYVPCNQTAVENGEHSSCCNLGDLCMTNGLCMEPANEKKGANHYWRNGCTDPTWKDPSCPNYCRGKEEPDHLNAFIFYCFSPKNEFCCTPQGTLEAGVTGRNTSCCNDDDLVFKAAAPEVFATAASALPHVSTSRSSSSSTSLGKTSTTISQSTTATVAAVIGTNSKAPTTTPVESSSSQSGMSSGAKAGLGVGITLGVLVILAIVGAVFFLRRKRANTYKDSAVLLDSKSNPPPYVTYESAGTVRAELEGTMLPAEMHNIVPIEKTPAVTGASREIEPVTPTKDSVVQKYA